MVMLVTTSEVHWCVYNKIRRKFIENSDVFITLDENIYGIHSKRVNILYVP